MIELDMGAESVIAVIAGFAGTGDRADNSGRVHHTNLVSKIVGDV